MIARGSPYRAKRRIVIAFDDDMFAEIRARAARYRTSFAEQVRLLTEWGLESADAL